MSRSYRKTPITGVTTCRSEKDDKCRANRIVRMHNGQRLRAGLDPLDRRALANPWLMGKDGKLWRGFDECRQTLIRK